ncbi:MAG: DUF927 domain-containing protein [Actinomycetota bacterium]|nr:DUF927 domain-containing protein [Actinomycetota bacterium]
MTELAYETREDGVVYELGCGVRVKVQSKSPSRVRVTMQHEEVFIPPETGDLGTSAFRSKLVGLARERFGHVPGLADDLDLIAVGCEAHLKEREDDASREDEETNAPEFVGTPYRIAGGGFVRLRNTREGEIPQRLTNFVARVEEEVVKDDGAEVKRAYRVEGETRDRKLPTTEVPAARFGGMNWVPEAWGLAATMSAGQGVKDFVREAIELRSRGAATKHLYAHTGFRELPGGDRVFLHAAGAVGAEGVEVELEPGLERYTLPTVGASTDLAAAVRQSLKLFEIAPARVMAPLLGAMYLAPLSGIVVPDFVLWLWAATGSFKSTISALLLSHFGDFSETTLPLSFESTSNALERALFLLKDVPAVVDDWRPAVSRVDASEMDRKAQRLLRGVGNRQGRGRMTSDITLRHSYPPRGLLIVTAEALPEGPAFESAASRALSVNFSREDVNLALLSDLQRHKDALSQAMAGYIGFVASRFDKLSGDLPTRRGKLREEVRAELASVHPRTPDAAASLIVGLNTLGWYAQSVGALEKADADEFVSRARAGVIEAARRHVEATKGDDPATRFVEILRSLFAGDGAWVKDRETDKPPADGKKLGGLEERETHEFTDIVPARSASFVGWVDDRYLYLDKDAAYAAVVGFAKRGGIPFSIKPRTLWKALALSRVSLTDPERNDTTAWICGKSARVVQVPRATVFEGERDE